MLLSVFIKSFRRYSFQFRMSSSSSPPRFSSDVGDTRSSDRRALLDLMEEGVEPKVLLNHLVPSFRVPPDADEMMLWRLLVSIIEPPRRRKLTQFNTIEDAIDLIRKSKKIMVLSGAGISTSAGLPDFRSRDGIYVQIHAEHPDLIDPKSMFDIDYFRKNPLPFYQFAKALYPGQYKPTIGHNFIKSIEEHNKLLRNYSQNIDTLEKQANIERVVECHGSFARASCTNCKYSVDCDVIRADIMKQKVPLCPRCHNLDDQLGDKLGVMKPNIVFFGEQLGNEFHSSIESDKEEVDLLIVIGSSLKVRPVALIPRSIPPEVPQILINKEPLDHMEFDIELLGNCDEIIQELCLGLGNGWTKICEPDKARLVKIDGLTDTNARLILENSKSLGIEQKNIEKETSTETRIGQDNVSMSSLCEADSEELNSFRSSQVNVASESIEHNMIEELDEIKDEENEHLNETKNDSESAISGRDHSSEEDWEDIEILHSGSNSPDVESRDRADICIPESYYLFLKPNISLFTGAELTNAQFESYTKEKFIREGLTRS